MRRISLLCCLLFLAMIGLAQAGEPCHDEACSSTPPPVVVTIPQPMPGPRPPAPAPGVSVRVNVNRGPVARVIAVIFGRNSGTTVNVR